MAAQGEAHRPKAGSKRALAQLERPMARVIYDEDCDPVLDEFANGELLTRAVRRHRLDWFAFRRFINSTPERAARMAEAERMHAWKLMEKSLFTADGLLKKNKTVASLMAYYRIARDWGKALDNQRWGEKVEVAARALVINTNVGGEIGDAGTLETAGGTWRMELGEASSPVVLGECERVLSALDGRARVTDADVQQVLQQSNIDSDPGVD